MAQCPSCHRPVAVARERCLYCDAALPADLLATFARDEADPAPPAEALPRGLIVLDLEKAAPEALAGALGLPSYEAALLVRRGGLVLHRVAAADDALQEKIRLEARGLAAFLVPEPQARVRPLRAIGGTRSEQVVSLRTEEGDAEVRAGELLLVVRGPIVREYLPSLKRRRVDTARLEEGYRVHLHRLQQPRPVEIDASAFEFGFAPSGSSRLELEAWVEMLLRGASPDDGFRWLTPALSPAEPEPRGPLAAMSSLRAGRAERPGRAEGGEPQMLDNVEQFRFYSGWRAAVERMRREGTTR
jgi:hypothetical protein